MPSALWSPPLLSGLEVAEQAQLVSTEAHAGPGGPRLWSCVPAAGLLAAAATAPTTDLSGKAVLYIAAEFNLVKLPMAAGGASSCGDPRQRGAPGAAALVQRRLMLPLTTLMLPTGAACAKAAAAADTAAAAAAVARADPLQLPSSTPAAALPASAAPATSATSAAASSAAAASTSATSSSTSSYGQYGGGGFTFTMLALDEDARQRKSDEDGSSAAATAIAGATDCGRYAGWMTEAVESLQRRGIVKKSLTCPGACVSCWRLAAAETAVSGEGGDGWQLCEGGPGAVRLHGTTVQRAERHAGGRQVPGPVRVRAPAGPAGRAGAVLRTGY
ncbi:hypothetical protein HYH03_010284 [Edaphochlamys debaryana]|uniref:Uncharacterized protein n=1 Tax=Edaphochlamys debaryana TaxID=47281 RepID=A0A836BWS2_9CHLO|nr:hypothetical protein HYH03_010284 [Edaphochlamys debaryana]|eukprot:KAG2491277.1 hypothetical protein HYH03_010284 [Edaphochlamys debaryana]